MFVATVTVWSRPAWAMMSASPNWRSGLALSTWWRMPRLSSTRETRSDVATDAVPTSTGWPRS